VHENREKETGMPKNTEVAETEVAETEVAETVEGAVAFGYPDSPEYQWDTVHTEAGDQLVFDMVGDLYIGIYAGHEIIYPDPNNPNPDKAKKWFVQLKWTDPEGAKFTNAGYELRTAYTETTIGAEGQPIVTDKIPIGSMTRNELKKLVDVDQQSEMKSFRVDVASLVNANHSRS
jgi:hypothetical protein